MRDTTASYIECWAELDGFLVSCRGRVRGKRGALLKPRTNPFTGYVMVSNRYLHQLVLCAHRGPRPVGYQACHNDGDKQNNVLSNLRWDTPSANQADRRKHGTCLQGMRNPSAKLTAEDVREIRQSGEALGALAARFGVTRSAVCLARSRRTWRHVE